MKQMTELLHFGLLIFETVLLETWLLVQTHLGMFLTYGFNWNLSSTLNCFTVRFWFELRGSVRGNSLTIPSINSTNPRITLLTLFLNNTAHSNGDTGVRTYPNGLGPRNKNVRKRLPLRFISS